MEVPKPFALPPDVLHLVLDLGVRKTYKRGYQFSGSPSSANLFFVQKGAMRSFLQEDDSELTYWINIEGEFSCTMNFFTGISDETFLEALEPLEVIEIKRDLLYLSYQHDPTIAHFGRMLAEHQLGILARNYLILTEKSAWNRYLMFLKCYPHLNGRLPLKYIASMLKLDPATISRVRKKLQHSTSFSMTF